MGSYFEISQFLLAAGFLHDLFIENFNFGIEVCFDFECGAIRLCFLFAFLNFGDADGIYRSE